MNGSLHRLAALITGASSGIGRAIALELTRRGASVGATGRNAARLREVLSELTAIAAPSGVPQSFAETADVRSAADMSRVVGRAVAAFGRLDAVIVCAGVADAPQAALPRPLPALRAADWDHILQTNLTGAFLALRATLPIMMEQGHGEIVLISSARAGRYGSPYAAAYCASKFGLNALAACAGEEAAPHGVRIRIVSPDLTATPMLIGGGTQRMAGNTLEPDAVAGLVAHLLESPGDATHRNATIAAIGNARELATRWGSHLSTGIL